MIKNYTPKSKSEIPHQEEKVTYVGDSGVVIDKDCVNIQIHRILPREDKTTVMKEKEQYMFAIYIPKEKTYFVKGN